MKKRKKIQKRRNINRMLRISPEKTYRSMKGENAEPVKVMPSNDETQSFCSFMWGKEVKHKQDAPWIQVLRHEYCVETQQE